MAAAATVVEAATEAEVATGNPGVSVRHHPAATSPNLFNPNLFNNDLGA